MKKSWVFPSFFIGCYLDAYGSSQHRVLAGRKMTIVNGRRIVSAGAAVLTVVLSVYFCCSAVAPMKVMRADTCCHKQCARVSVAPPSAVIAEAKRGGERPLAIVATLSSGVHPTPFTSLTVDAEDASSSRLFDPLSTIQLRI